jgi:heterodisulfide reductase subunit A-like polyferredoxin
MAPAVYEPRAVTNSALVIGAGLSGLAAARNMAVQGYGVTFISALDVINLKKQSAEYRQNADMLLKELMELNVRVNPWPQALELNGAPGKYEAVMKYGEQTSKIEAGVVILDLYKAGKDDLDVLANSNLISRVIARQHNMSRISNLDATTVHSFTVREIAGIFMIAPAGEPSTAEQITMGEATAARASTYLTQETFKPRSSSVVINKKMCRGCGDCVSLCPYIELQPDSRGVSYASIDPALCFGCGACISVCPTGAISQPLQSESGITAALESLLKKAKSGSEA